MKNLFFCFTPYHVKVSNKIAEKCDRDDNYIITTENSKVNNFIDKKVYKSKESFFLEDIIKIRARQFITNKELRKKAYDEMCKLEDYVEKINPDKIFIFSDNPIYIQKILIKTKAKIILVEEGTGMYATNNKYTNTEKIGFYIWKRLALRCKEARLFTHGKGGYEDFVVVREPDLIINKSKKVKLDKEFFKEIFNDHRELDLEKGYLYSPAGTTYDKDKMLNVTKELFEKFYNSKNILYVKLHPREKYEQDIKMLIKKYEEYIRLIDDKTITSEDVILNENIKGLISDFSSMLINVTYLRDNIEAYTTLNIIEGKYGVDLNLNYTILNYLRETGIIKNIEELKL